MIKIICKKKYFLAGFPSIDGGGNVWILLNPKYAPYYKQIPEVEFSITTDDIEKIKRVNGVSSKVVEELEFRLKTNYKNEQSIGS